jgi:hypothetical protein
VTVSRLTPIPRAPRILSASNLGLASLANIQIQKAGAEMALIDSDLLPASDLKRWAYSKT